MNDDVKLAVTTLQRKTVEYTPLFDYYRGEQPLMYAADRLRDIFQNRQTRFTENWCALVVNALLDRIRIERWEAGSNANDDAMAALWSVSGLDADAEAVHRSVAVCGEGYVVCGVEDHGPAAYYHDPRMCQVWYYAEQPRAKRMAAKWWRGDDTAWRLNLYYQDRIEHYTGGSSDMPNAGAFVLDGEEPNSFGALPVFHFYRDKFLLQGELTNVLPLQDAVNKLLADMMIAAEFGAFRQRWIITNSDTSKLRNAPNEIWELPAAGPGEQQTSVGEFSPNDLGNYLNAVDRLAQTIGIITQTPRHYFFAQGGDPSGEALIAMEAPLIRKVEQYQAALGRGWRDVALFLLAQTNSGLDSAAVQPVWANASTIQPRTQAEIRQFSVSAGLPLTTTLRKYEGWDDAELDKMQAEKEAEGEAQRVNLATALTNAQRQFDQNQL